LLILHGLHPFDLETRVRQALDKVRPYLGSHGGNVELLGVTAEGVVRLRLAGSCHGCPSSQVTLKYAIEEEIYKAAPDLTAIQVEGAVDNQPVRPPDFVPVAELLSQNSHGGGWVEVESLASLKEGSLRTIEVAGLTILFCRIGEMFYAYSQTCPHCGQLLAQARLAGKDLICIACGHRYDLMRAGRDLDEPTLHLEPFPLLVERGQVKVALPSLEFGF
jgi:Fe-S cluster biogenesis protein NfuA/nitrite reductase/ring-hydroxylating ferredoxin subunit